MANPTVSTAGPAPSVTSVSVEPATPVRTRPARPEKRPEIKLTPAKQESRFVGPLPIAIGLISIVAMLGFAQRLTSKVEDPHFVQATAALSEYELGKSETERNYDSSIYTDALASLAKVDPNSISAEKAAALVSDIQIRTDAFHRRIKASDEAARAIQEARDNRDQEYLAAREKALVMPQKDFPECKEGEGSHDH